MATKDKFDGKLDENLDSKLENGLSPWQNSLHEVIFEADTPGGKFFDVVLLILIVLSLVLIMLESVEAYNAVYGRFFRIAEYTLTVLFTIEYILRIVSVLKPKKYIFSFFGIVDLLSILPTYIGLFITGGSAFMVIRSLRLLRVFRVFKLGRYVSGAQLLSTSLKQSVPKIVVFIFTVVMLTLIMGCAMYLIEGSENGFTSIPKSMYWAIVTITTVGYGDIAPQTAIGQALASLLMIMGYGIIAVPTGIVTADLINTSKKQLTTQSCPECTREGHDADAHNCKYCGHIL